MNKKHNINSRKLLHEIVFMELNSAVFEEEKWEIKFRGFAEILPICDAKFETIEDFNFGHVMTEAYFLFKMRFCVEINNKMRIVFKKRKFEVKRIINIDEQNRYLNIIALEI